MTIMFHPQLTARCIICSHQAVKVAASHGEGCLKAKLREEKKQKTPQFTASIIKILTLSAENITSLTV